MAELEDYLYMRYNTEVTITLPREKVVEYFDSFDNLKEWQTGLKSFEAISGAPGERESKTKLVYDMNGKDVEILETVLMRSLPDEYNATYESKGLRNFVANKFMDEGSSTRWVKENEFKFGGFRAIMSIFKSGSFKKQTQSDMNKFKSWAEGIPTG